LSDKLPEYDVLKQNEGFLRLAMAKPKGSMQFDRFKEKIVTRLDRFDPEWHTQLQYESIKQKETSLEKKLCFDNQTNRQPNDIHSKYPIRLSL
jgi:hypothetical protein